MPPVAVNNGFGPVIGHLNTLKDLLDKMEAKLKGIPYQPSSLPQGHVGNNAGNSPLSNITVNAGPNKPARGNGLGNNPLSGITPNTTNVNKANAAAAIKQAQRDTTKAIASNVAAAAREKKVAGNLLPSSQLGNAARENSKAAADAKVAAESANLAAEHVNNSSGNLSAANQGANAAAEKVKKAAANAAKAAAEAAALGNNPLSGITVNTNKHVGNNAGKNPLKTNTTLFNGPNKPKNNGLGNNPLSAISTKNQERNNAVSDARKAVPGINLTPNNIAKAKARKTAKNAEAAKHNLKAGNEGYAAAEAKRLNAVRAAANAAAEAAKVKKGGRRTRKRSHKRRRSTRRN